MGAMELASPALTIAPLLVRNIVSSAFMYADSSLLSLSQKHKLLQHCRSLILTIFLFVLRALPSLFPSLDFDLDSFHKPSKKDDFYYVPTSDDGDGDRIRTASLSFAGDSGIARALSQLLSIANEIPVSSRKYEVVWLLVEKIIDDNQKNGAPALRKVNRTVLSAAFARTLCQLEAAFEERALEAGLAAEGGRPAGPVNSRFGGLVLRPVWVVGEYAKARLGMFVGVRQAGGAGHPPRRLGGSAEKLMAELHWLAHKMAACGFAEEAIWRWGSASNLARLGITAEPRLQCSLVRISGKSVPIL
ncbi:hypothetical protein L484_017184 [Morus notabilis]|uniref:Uncharacterized protein n=1 Tax=Morus notabilis TaxID=981085 RepID=W9QVE7_9ROSA|nr:hypothetical protein L484_017184 [Morus notabilis]